MCSQYSVHVLRNEWLSSCMILLGTVWMSAWFRRTLIEELLTSELRMACGVLAAFMPVSRSTPKGVTNSRAKVSAFRTSCCSSCLS